ncbi:MAG TPA: hypothetical protein PKN33_16490 [Phycisphaerae bacterium]|nr:hypothetical protein [Phycisphaerae bacterium]
MNRYLETIYREFEDEHFDLATFWRAPACLLQGTILYPLFERFAEAFPDHVGDDNTVFYLTESTNVMPIQRSIILTNSHFEHTHYEDVVKLIAFIEDASKIINAGKMASIDRLDGIREEIILVFHDPMIELVGLFKKKYQQRSGRRSKS